MDFERIHKELSKPNVTMTLPHDEYIREAQSVKKISYAYRTFAEHYHNYAKKHKVKMRIWLKTRKVFRSRLGRNYIVRN